MPRYLAVLAVVAFSHAAMGDILSLVGGTSGNYSLGWMGEGWKNGNWCGDTLLRDASPDTIVSPPDTIHDFFISGPISDTVIVTVQPPIQYDSLFVSTTLIQSQTILRDSIDDPIVDIVTNYTTIIDSNIIAFCGETDFITDTGGITEGALYFNYYYKFRNYWAQLPFVWNNWQGYDSLTVIPYTDLLITYKGLLPVHQIQLGFFYGTWGAFADTMKTFLKLGDGVGTLVASPDEWKTVIIHIPDSVTLPGITGITLSIENVPNGGGAQTSEVGNLKIDQIALLTPDNPTRHMKSLRGVRHDRFHFVPKTAGRVSVSVFSLNGALLGTKTLSVDPSRRYSIRQLAQIENSMASGQVRIVKIQGAGVNLKERIW